MLFPLGRNLHWLFCYEERHDEGVLWVRKDRFLDSDTTCLPVACHLARAAAGLQVGPTVLREPRGGAGP